MIKTAKFGGTSLADAERIKNATKIIKSDSARRYIIVSAPGKRHEGDEKITDLLYCCAACRGTCEVCFQTTYERFTEIIKNLELDLDIAKDIDIIKKNIADGADEDYIASRGEYLTARILSLYLGYEFVDSADIIKFKGETLDTNLTKRLTAKRLDGVDYAVIPGFYGSREDGSIKTFSRGGSDYTGAIIADAVGAELYENWTDVDGFMAIDPKIIENPRKIKELSYDELYRLSRAGATVMHPCSVLPLKKSKIKINIRNTFNPCDEGTIIAATSANRDEELAGISVKEDCWLLLVKHQTAEKAIVVKRLFNLINSVGGKIERMTAGVGAVELILKEPLYHMELNYIKAKLHEMEITQKNMTLISLIGYRKKDLIKRVFTVLNENNEIDSIGYGQGSDLIIGVPASEDINGLINNLYHEFFG